MSHTKKYSEGGGEGYRLRLFGNTVKWEGFNGHKWVIVSHKFDGTGAERSNWDVYVSGFHVLWTDDFNAVDRVIDTFGGGVPLLDDDNAEWVECS